MQLIDTHTHLYLPEFDIDRDEVVNRAVSKGVIKMLMPNIDLHSVDLMLSASKRYPDICYSMIGLHPTSVKENYQSQLDELESLIAKHKFIAIGEIGIDLYWEKALIREQINAFQKQVAFSLDLGLPVVIHARESFPEVFSVLNEFKGQGLKGVFHAFSGSIEDAEKAISMGFKLGIGGIVTFKNSGLDKIVKETGPENLILETDSPYLAPAPYRGKRNESSYICIINQKLADIFGLSEEDVASITFSNSTRLFNL
ncbi:MAG TPA: TatD family hydrolase [Bacteroidales bacterium]|nr:TatD family hydrolase [Bacteroidales bacterium]